MSLSELSHARTSRIPQSRRDTCPLSCTLTSPGRRDQMCFGQFPAVTCCPFTWTSRWSCHCPWLGHGPQSRGLVLGQGSPAWVCSVIVTVQGVQCHCHHPGFAVWLLLLHPPPRIPKNKGCFAKHCPTPCCLLPRTEGIRAFPKSGTGMISGKGLGPSLADLALPQRAPEEGGPLCPDRSILRGPGLHSAWCCHLLRADTVTAMSPQGSGAGPVPCLVLGIADSRHAAVTDLPWCHTSRLSLRLLWSLNFVLGACPYPPPQLAPASEHQARLNPCGRGHISPPYLKVITKDGGAPCAPPFPPKPCC